MSEIPPAVEDGPSSDGPSVLPVLPAWLARTIETLDRANLPLLASALTFDALLALIPLTILLISGLGQLLAQNSYFDAANPGGLIISILPQHTHGVPGADPFQLVEDILAQIRGYKSPFTLVAIPAFIWLSTRLFAVHARVPLPRVPRAAEGRARTLGAERHRGLPAREGARPADGRRPARPWRLVNTMISATIGAGHRHRASRCGRSWTLLVSTGGYVVGHLLTIMVGWALFAVLYRYASPKRLDWLGAGIAGGVATFGFELAKQLFGLYINRASHSPEYSLSTNINAGLLLLAWLWYMALVFLIGAAVADVWDHSRKSARQEPGKVVAG